MEAAKLAALGNDRAARERALRQPGGHTNGETLRFFTTAAPAHRLAMLAAGRCYDIAQAIWHLIPRVLTTGRFGAAAALIMNRSTCSARPAVPDEVSFVEQPEHHDE
jgi:hypothetical protein